MKFKFADEERMLASESESAQTPQGGNKEAKRANEESDDSLDELSLGANNAGSERRPTAGRGL